MSFRPCRATLNIAVVTACQRWFSMVCTTGNTCDTELFEYSVSVTTRKRISDPATELHLPAGPGAPLDPGLAN